MIRAVLDTNVFLAAALAVRRANQDSPALRILMAARLGLFVLIVSDRTLRELDAVLRRKAFDLPQAFVDEFIGNVAKIARFVRSDGLDLGSSDRKDNIIVEATINGRADYLVTRDADFQDISVSHTLRKRRVSVVNVTTFSGLIDDAITPRQ